MPRYFIEVAYKGTNYAGFQIQKNANSIQAEVEKALNIFFHFNKPGDEGVSLTGSSRTDAGVHALQNFFHFDTVSPLSTKWRGAGGEELRGLNAILPPDIVIKSITPVADHAHCRFDAKSRTYHYYIYQQKDPFLQEKAHYYPYPIHFEMLQQAAAEILQHQNFASFSKKHAQAKTHECIIMQSSWQQLPNHVYVYQVTGNRFLRGMVKGLVGTMLQVARKKITLPQFQAIIHAHDNTRADFSVPSKGLFLIQVKF